MDAIHVPKQSTLELFAALKRVTVEMVIVSAVAKMYRGETPTTVIAGLTKAVSEGYVPPQLRSYIASFQHMCWRCGAYIHGTAMLGEKKDGIQTHYHRECFEAR